MSVHGGWTTATEQTGEQEASAQAQKAVATNELVLVVDDEDELRGILSRLLQYHGYTVVEASDANAAGMQIASREPDIVVLDLGLPDRNGLDLLREIRTNSEVPVIVLSGWNDEVDRVVGLELGADDYIAKPFSGRELVARIRTILRRGRSEPARLLQFDGLTINLDTREVMLPDHSVVLTTREFDLLAFLARSPRQVFSVSQLLLHVWHTDPAWQDRSTVAEHVYRIRRKIGPAPDGHSWIGTVRNSGYRFQP